MNKTQATAIIRGSLERGSSTPCTWRDDRDKYIEEKTQELLSAVVDPSETTIAWESFKQDDDGLLNEAPCLIVASASDQHLVYFPRRGEFGLAFDLKDKSVGLLGYSSNDALAEWLG